MKDQFEALEMLVAQDVSGRGLSALVQPGHLAAAARSLAEGERVGIVSGFFLPHANAGKGAGETDGPPGVKALAQALEKSHIKTCVLTDEPNQPLFQALGLQTSTDHENFLETFQPSHLVAIERPGRAHDGKYYNMRGADITRHTAPLDRVFLEAGDRPTIGIGDGGNEIGMGLLAEVLPGKLKGEAHIACVVKTNWLILADVSNWGAYALVAGLSLLAGKNLLPSPAEAITHVETLVAHGAVDGVTLAHEATVDGLPLATTSKVLGKMHDLIASQTS